MIQASGTWIIDPPMMKNGLKHQPNDKNNNKK